MTAVQNQTSKLPSRFHASMYADLLVRDPGQGHILNVTFGDGRTYRAKASAEVLRLGARLNGRLRAALHIRTDNTSVLQEPLYLFHAVPLIASNYASGQVHWSAAGLVAADSHALVIFPKDARSLPYRLHFQPQQKNIVLYPVRESLSVSGPVVAGTLIATRLQVCEPIKVPTRWQIWERWL